ncbi:beta-1,3-galactosyltransferase 2-like [Polymixia lowei]
MLLVLTLVLGLCYSNDKLSLSSNLWRKRLWLNKPCNTATIVENTSPVDQSTIEKYFVAYPHQYRFMLDEPDKCRQQKPFLVLMVPVAPQNWVARDAIRKTWAGETTVLGQVVTHFFVMGKSTEGDGPDPLQEKVLEESQKHHDLLQSDFLDSYHNLTIKTMVMLEWLISRCPSASYAMKIDSDMFLNTHNLVAMLLEAPKHDYMTGLMVRGAVVLRDPNSKWFLPEEAFPEYYYPTYALGMGYVFSLDLPQKLIEASRHVKAVYIEDVYLGLCLRYLGIEPIDPPSGSLFRTWLPLEC